MTIVMCKMYVMCAIRGIYLVLGKWEGQEESMELVILWLKLQVRVTLTITSKWSGEVKVLQAEPVYSVVSDFFDPMDYKPTKLLCPWNFPGRNTGVVSTPSSRTSSQPSDRTCIFCSSCIDKWVLYHWTTWEACSRQREPQTIGCWRLTGAETPCNFIFSF